MTECTKCKGSRIVDDSGLQLFVAMMDHPTPKILYYPCPKCCNKAHKAVMECYKEYHEDIKHLKETLDIPALGSRIEKLELMELADKCGVDPDGVNMRITVIPSAVVKIMQLEKEIVVLRENYSRMKNRTLRPKRRKR